MKRYERIGRWVAETRIGRTVFRLGALVLVSLFVFTLVNLEVGRQTRAIVKRIEVIERVRPIDVLRKCLQTPKCRRILLAPEDVDLTRGGDASQPAPVAGQLPEPAAAGDGDRRSKQQQGGSDESPVPEKPGSPDPLPPPPAATPVTTPSTVQPETKGPPDQAQGPPDTLPEAAGQTVEKVLGKVCSLVDHLAKAC